MSFISLCSDKMSLAHFLQNHTLHDVSMAFKSLTDDEVAMIKPSVYPIILHYLESYPSLWSFLPTTLLEALAYNYPSKYLIEQAVSRRCPHIFYDIYLKQQHDLTEFKEQSYFEYCSIQHYFKGYIQQPALFHTENLYDALHIKMLTLLKSFEFDMNFLHKIDIFLSDKKAHLPFVETQKKWRYIFPTLWYDNILTHHEIPDGQELVVIINSLLWLLEEPCILQPWNFSHLMKSHIVFILESIQERAIEGVGTVGWMRSIQLLDKNYSISELLLAMRTEPWQWVWLSHMIEQPMIMERAQALPNEPWLECFLHAHKQTNQTMREHTTILNVRYPQMRSSDECDLLV